MAQNPQENGIETMQQPERILSRREQRRQAEQTEIVTDEQLERHLGLLAQFDEALQDVRTHVSGLPLTILQGSDPDVLGKRIAHSFKDTLVEPFVRTAITEQLEHHRSCPNSLAGSVVHTARQLYERMLRQPVSTSQVPHRNGAAELAVAPEVISQASEPEAVRTSIDILEEKCLSACPDRATEIAQDIQSLGRLLASLGSSPTAHALKAYRTNVGKVEKKYCGKQDENQKKKKYRVFE
jgi:hypothetical protein